MAYLGLKSCDKFCGTAHSALVLPWIISKILQYFFGTLNMYPFSSVPLLPVVQPAMKHKQSIVSYHVEVTMHEETDNIMSMFLATQ